MDYSLSDWPSGNGVRIGLSIDSDYAVPREYNVQRLSFGHMDFPDSPRAAYVYENGIKETVDLSGKLSIKRIGTTLFGYYEEGKNFWGTVDSTQVAESDLHFGLSA